MNIPTYRIVIDMEDNVTGMSAISLVDNPAIEIDFMCFKEQQVFKSDNERHVISGPAILADTPIYRYHPARGEYYVVFEKETIRQLVEKYSREGMLNNVNLQHDSLTFVNSAIMIESMIIDKERGICPNEFKDIPDGSWIVSYKITDDNLWDEIKTSGVLNGFSIEIMSDLELIEFETNKINTKNNMNLFRFAKAILKLAEIPTDKETLVIQGEIEVGKPVFVETEEGPVPAADGEYILEDGKKVIVAEGIITEIVEVEVEKVEERVEVLEEEVIVEEKPVEDDRVKELEDKIAELEAMLAERDARIAELEADIAEKDEKLKMSVETPITKKTIINKENKALKYFN